MPAKPKTPPKSRTDLPVQPFASAKAFETWLAKHHASSPGVWMKIAKTESGIASVTYPEALEVALCYGWIDGQKGALDDTWWLQRFTPRKARSRWSKINCGKVEALEKAGRMRPAGMREVEAAKADGRWAAAYEGQKVATVPEDLLAALAAKPKALAFFEGLTGRNRYAILYRVGDAKRPETRAKRIREFVAMCAAGKTVY